MNQEQKPTQIAFNFGPVNGNVEKQEIHLDKSAEAQQPSGTDEEEEGKTAEGMPGKCALSVKQLIILFMETLDITLDATDINQSALARLIAQVSGYTEKSVRPKIAKGVDYDEKQTRHDAELIAALLDEIKPELAERIRNNIAK